MFMYPSPKVQPTTCSFFKVTKGLNPANGISLNSCLTQNVCRTAIIQSIPLPIMKQCRTFSKEFDTAFHYKQEELHTISKTIDNKEFDEVLDY